MRNVDDIQWTGVDGGLIDLLALRRIEMNHFSYDLIRKEKIRDLQVEGLQSQAIHRSGAPKFGLLRGLPKLIMALLAILATLGSLLR